MKKRNNIIYWIATIWLALGMISTGLVQLVKGKTGTGGVETLTHLGYPLYLLGWLGICKLLGVMVLLIPNYPLLKEWVYAGFTYIMLGALYSHVAMGDAIGEILPVVLLLLLTALSWYFRPASRKIAIARP